MHVLDVVGCVLHQNGSLPQVTPQAAHLSIGTEGAGKQSEGTAGGVHACTLKADGSAVCWGPDLYGEATPPAGERFTSISAGALHTCAVDLEETLHCWGDNEWGKTEGDGATGISAVSSGVSHTCALTTEKFAVCWGGGRQADPPEHIRFLAISSGTHHTCAIREDGAPVCWGAHERNLP